MRLFRDLRNPPLSLSPGLVATDPGLASLGGGGRPGPVSWLAASGAPLPRAPFYLLGALALGLALVAAAPHRSTQAASLSQLAWQARDGNPAAQLLLGLAYRHGGYGLKPDAAAGTGWIAQAARGGNAYAAGLLTGVDARHGAVPRVGLAQLWGMRQQSGAALQRRARDGDPVAQFQLAMRYRDGAWGVDADPRLARAWLEQAARHGNPVALRALAADGGGHEPSRPRLITHAGEGNAS